MCMYEKARHLLQQEPGSRREIVSASHITSIAGHGAERHSQETADGYDNVLVALDQQHRVITCRDRLQWILQRRKNGGAERPWRALGYFRTKAALIRACASFNPRLDPNLMAILVALPDVIRGAS